MLLGKIHVQYISFFGVYNTTIIICVDVANQLLWWHEIFSLLYILATSE